MVVVCVGGGGGDDGREGGIVTSHVSFTDSLLQACATAH